MQRMKIGCLGWIAILFLAGLAIQNPIPSLVIGLVSVFGIYLWVKSIRSKSQPVWKGDYPPGTPPSAKESSPHHETVNKTTQQGNGKFPRLHPGPEFEVVGESFYADNFHKLMKLLGCEPEDEAFVDIVLENEPNNRFSLTGHAVAVKVSGLMVGHISEAKNTQFFKVIEKVGGSVLCTGRVWFDEPGGDIERNSVQLFVKMPPRIESD